MSSQFHFDKEKTRKNIALIRERMQKEADLHLLGEYRSFFKQNVSLFRRSWFAAYLLMMFDQAAPNGRSSRNVPDTPDRNKFRKTGVGRSKGEPRTDGPAEGAKFGGSENAASDGENSAEERRYPFTDEESKRLFISIGRNRRIFPREILGLISTKASVAREDVGAIRILDNYSFVQVRDTTAECIIEALNGQTFRGRRLTVNYAKSRKEAEALSAENMEGMEGEEYPYAEEAPRNGEAGEPDAGSSSSLKTGPDAPPDSPAASEEYEDHPDKENI